jgi:hypothetical protein
VDNKDKEEGFHNKVNKAKEANKAKEGINKLLEEMHQINHKEILK